MDILIHIRCKHKLAYNKLEELCSHLSEYLYIDSEQSWETKEIPFDTIPTPQIEYVYNLFCNSCKNIIEVNSINQPIKIITNLIDKHVEYKTLCPICKNIIINRTNL